MHNDRARRTIFALPIDTLPQNVPFMKTAS